MVIRAFPVRVGGNSGNLPDEINWETITNESLSDNSIVEYTSVTKTLRRVARFNPDIVKQAIKANKPTCIVLNHLDYIDASCKDINPLTKKVSDFLDKIQSQIERKIDFLGFGPNSTIKFI